MAAAAGLWFRARHFDRRVARAALGFRRNRVVAGR
jgi:hypothetical protein